jgi:DNA polymerase III psi subunit
MSINQRQFALLNEMGISLWQRSALSTKADPSTQNSQNLLVDLNALAQQSLFQDILLSLNLSLNDINEHNNDQSNAISLGEFTWQFSSDNAIDLSATTLSTPVLANIAESPQLKRQLWQVLQDKKV